MLLNECEAFWKNLEKIQVSFQYDDQSFAKFLGINPSLYLKKKASIAFLPVNCIFELAEKMNFHFEDLLKMDFHPRSIIQNPTAPLSERYNYATYSELLPIRNIISYLELTRGYRAKINLLRKFQLNENFFDNNAQKTNIFLISDITKYLKETYNFTDDEFLGMGKRTPHIIKSEDLYNNLTRHRSVEELMDYFAEECTSMFDKNYHYRISKIVNHNAFIEAIPKKHVLDELKINKKILSNEETCLTRMGVISSITFYKYGMNAPISKVSSLLNGDPSNGYLLDLNPFQKSSSNLSILRPTSFYQ